MGVLEGHHAVVTGGASGIGLATANRMHAEGSAVALVDIDEEGARAAAEPIGAHAYGADVADHEALAGVMDRAAAEMGGLSILVCNAGSSNIDGIHEWDADEWARIVAVNLAGVYHAMRAAIPHMLAAGDGRIVSLASISGTRPAAGESPYSAAKAGVVALTATAAIEYGPTIRANAVSPGMIRTPLTEPLFDLLPGHLEELVARTPAGRAGDPADVADVIVFLCSDAARFITGQNVVVDGGLTLHGSGVDGVLEAVRHLTPGPDS